MDSGQENIRFADYFFRAGLKSSTSLMKSRMKDSGVDLSSLNLGASSENLDESDQNKREPHPLTYKYEPDTIFRYPSEDYSEHEKFPSFTPMVIPVSLISSFVFQKISF